MDIFLSFKNCKAPVYCYLVMQHTSQRKISKNRNFEDKNSYISCISALAQTEILIRIFVLKISIFTNFCFHKNWQSYKMISFAAEHAYYNKLKDLIRSIFQNHQEQNFLKIEKSYFDISTFGQNLNTIETVPILCLIVFDLLITTVSFFSRNRMFGNFQNCLS